MFCYFYNFFWTIPQGQGLYRHDSRSLTVVALYHITHGTSNM